MRAHTRERDAGRALDYIEGAAKLLDHHHLARGALIMGLRLPVSNAKQLQKLEKTLVGLRAEFERYAFQRGQESYKVELEVRKSEAEYEIYPRLPENMDFSESLRLSGEAWQRILSRLGHFIDSPYR